VRGVFRWALLGVVGSGSLLCRCCFVGFLAGRLAKGNSSACEVESLFVVCGKCVAA
jgi:hypothetical protein